MDTEHIINQVRELLSQQIYANDGLNEYERYILQVENNLTSEPNICLEACKALCEGVFRHILKHEKIGVEYRDILNSSSATTVELYKNAYKALDQLDVLDGEIAKCGKQFFHTLAEMRNSIGLMSHGKDLASTPNITPSTARMTVLMSFTYLLFLLDSYGLTLDIREIKYEKNKNFNEYLDSGYDLDIKYSQALFDQDRVLYEDLLDKYKASKDEERL